MNIKSTNHSYVNGKFVLEMKHYLEDFPYQYYIIVKVRNLKIIIKKKNKAKKYFSQFNILFFL
jgi:hypothetical protein